MGDRIDNSLTISNCSNCNPYLLLTLPFPGDNQDFLNSAHEQYLQMMNTLTLLPSTITSNFSKIPIKQVIDFFAVKRSQNVEQQINSTNEIIRTKKTRRKELLCPHKDRKHYAKVTQYLIIENV